MVAMRSISRLLASLAAVVVLLGGIAAGPIAPTARAAGPLPAWDGSVDLYREGAFTTQASWLWCTAAGIQIARNLVFDEDDHRASSQERYFDWMRGHNRYDLPESAGVDPAGWQAGMREFVDERYQLVSHETFDQALRLAVTRIRLTELPVALTVAHGGHGWLLTGFTATADPAVTDEFRIRSVRVTGPLYGRQSRNGYDMPPDTSLTVAELERFFTPWRYDPLPMVWDGRYVSIQPMPAEAAAMPIPTVAPSAEPTSTPMPTAAPTPTPAASAEPSDAAVAEAAPPAAATGSTSRTAPDAVDTDAASAAPWLIVIVIGFGVATMGMIGLVVVRSRRGRTG
jgi:hypothetical protein